MIRPLTPCDQIRHMIFTLAVTEDKRLFLDTLMPPPLCRASKQIRSETLALFLHCNEFHVVVAEYLGRFAAEFSPVTRIWLQEINVKAPLVANLRITFMPHEVDPHHFPAGLWDPAIVDLTYATDADRVILQHSGTSCRFCQPSKASSEASANLNLNLSPQHPVSQAVSQIVASIQAFTAQINADYHAFLKRRHDSNLQGFQNLFGLLTADGRRLSIVNICQFARGPESVRRNRAQETVQ